ncbi:hypothetical protein [Actinopolymorpha pittospori]|uniref:Secreted protein n=1 Tax=Actinopolymorpha pittospori TaxID=648752 RepID=A0A927MV12_9ACTN|nr:hypothetical protein [Actinopolymorpha pittospori]MBE1605768.1 hypothetical protein [Actinopolymorpha pittospori]
MRLFAARRSRVLLAMIMPALLLGGTVGDAAGQPGMANGCGGPLTSIGRLKPPPPGASAPGAISDDAMSKLRASAATSEAAHEIEAFARTAFPSSFTAVVVDHDSVVVHRTSHAAPDLDPAVTERFPAVRVRFVDSPRNGADLFALAERVSGDWDLWRANGVTPRRSGPDVTRGVVVLGIAEDANEIRARVAERYGDGVVVEGGYLPVCLD